MDGVHVFVVHLSPFRWAVRQRETEILLPRIRALIERGEEVMVLGDFNALSAADRELLELQPELLEKYRTGDPEHDHVENLRDGRLDYTVMDQFFQVGLVDVVATFVELEGSLRWTCTTETS